MGVDIDMDFESIENQLVILQKEAEEKLRSCDKTEMEYHRGIVNGIRSARYAIEQMDE